MADNLSTEAVVIGGGPAGMGTALSLAREGIEVWLLEKKEQVGEERRGETIRYDEEMDHLLGGGFFEKHAINKIYQRTYYSHTGLNQVSRTINNPNHIISWPQFLQDMKVIIQNEGVKVKTSSQVTGFLNEQNRISGVKVSNKKEGKTGAKEIKANGVFSCGGHEDPAVKIMNMDRSHIDLPVFKQLVSGYAGPMDRLEYFFHVEDGALAIATIFPRVNSEAEIILMGFPAGSGKQELTMEEFCRQHPLFAERLSGTDSFYSLKTIIPMGGMLSPCSPQPGLMITGDAMGHVQARGGSGIKTSFMIGYTAGKLSARAIKTGRWSRWTSQKINKKLERSPALSSLKKHNFLFNKLRYVFFNTMVKTPQDMDNYWKVLQNGLR